MWPNASPRSLRDERSNGQGTRISVGIAMARPGSGDAAELLRNADLAMYAAKDGGRTGGPCSGSIDVRG